MRGRPIEGEVHERLENSIIIHTKNNPLNFSSCFATLNTPHGTLEAICWRELLTLEKCARMKGQTAFKMTDIKCEICLHLQMKYASYMKQMICVRSNKQRHCVQSSIQKSFLHLISKILTNFERFWPSLNQEAFTWDVKSCFKKVLNISANIKISK